MCSCGSKKRSFFGGLTTLFLISVVGSEADLVSSSPPSVAATTAKNGPILLGVSAYPQEPVQPKPPNCLAFFPGTPGWNDCFGQFNRNMAKYQTEMQEFVRQQSQKIAEGPTSGESSSPVTRVGPGQYYSGSSFYSNAMSNSNSYTGGYAIHAVNMAMSTSLINNVVKVTLHTGPIDKFDTRAKGNEILITVMSKGQKKWAKIMVPQSVRVSNVKVERSSDSIYVTGPSSMNGGNYQISNSGGSGFAGSYSQNFGQMPMMPMPEFQNAFHNMFQNFFSNMFGIGGKPYTARNNRDASAAAPYAGPGWFY